MKPELSEALTKGLSFQSYDPGAQIDGVWQRALTKHRSENGGLMELARLEAGVIEGAPMEARQVNVSWADPGRLNAFHLHPKLPQNELWTVIAGQLLVWLVDCRVGSSSAGVKQRLILSSEQPAWLHVPAGVAHGYRAGAQGATLVYLIDQVFDPDDPNEGRLPWDAFGAELWEQDLG